MESNRLMDGKSKIVKHVLIFIAVLACMRLLWMYAFAMPGEYRAEHGVLDLRDRDMTVIDTVSLDGEWELYPRFWYPLEDKSIEGKFVLVPGTWDRYLQETNPTPYGSGSYRLKILVNPEQPVSMYSLYVPSIRTASELFVNGRLLHTSGQVAHTQESYTPHNKPYKVTFAADDSGEIELVIRVANFHDARGGGMVRPIKFGSEAAVEREYQLSTALVQMVGVAFMLHIAYAFILYVLGPRDIRMIYFACVLFCLMMIIVGNIDKVLMNWFVLPYTVDFRLKFLAILYAAFFLFMCVRQSSSSFWRDKGFKMYSAGTAAVSLAIIFLPFHLLMGYGALLMCVFAVFYLISAVLLVRLIFQEPQDMFFAILSFIALANGMVWDYIHTFLHMKIFFYPFDLIIAMLTFACIWFKRYFRAYDDAKQFAGKLQLMDKAKDEFLANTSHELRNPLHAILNITETVLEREKLFLKNKSKEDLHAVMNVGRRMSATLKDILDITRLKEREVQLEVRSVRLRRVVDDVLALLHYMIEEKGIRITKNVPDCCLLVMADEQRLHQIVFNLLHNAVKYTNEGEISITAELTDGRVCVCISDTGIGMNEAQQQTIFEPYSQVNNTNGRGGFGLGLRICRQLVELHGGTLAVDSVPGSGSSFRFDLAVPEKIADNAIEAESAISVDKIAKTASAMPVGETAKAETAVSVEAIGSPQTIKILAVDDDSMNLDVLSSIFAMEPCYEIVKTTSPQHALQLLRTQEWDLAILDVMMPGISGFELTRHIRERYNTYELPVLILTARVRPEDIEEGLLAGANDYVVKPVHAIELRARVKALTYLKRSIDKRINVEAAWRQAQMKPHFVLNTLGAVIALSDIDMQRMRNLVMEFATYLRTSFDSHNADRVINLQNELMLVRSYLNIEKERFMERLQIQWEIDDTVNVKIPPLSLQPLIENAIIHGIIKKMEGGTVHIRVADIGDYVEFSIRDDGVGMSEERVQNILYSESQDIGIGLRNTHVRLKQLYGEGLKITSTEGQGTTVSFLVPKEQVDKWKES